jgi:hypothetical protein
MIARGPGRPRDYYGEHVVYVVQEVLKTALKVPKTASYCPGNERCAVVSRRPRDIGAAQHGGNV